MLKRFVVKKNERAALLRDGDFERILSAGRHYFFDPLGQLSLVTWQLDAPVDDIALVDYLLQHEPEVVAEHIECMELGEEEAGLRYENEVLCEILPPGVRRFFWKGGLRQRLERVDLREDYRVAPALAGRLMQNGLRGRPLLGLNAVLMAQVPAYHVGVLKANGRIERLLEAGVEMFWRFNRDVQVELVDMRMQNLEVSGQEILSRDKVGLRLNLGATWRYTDVLLVSETEQAGRAPLSRIAVRSACCCRNAKSGRIAGEQTGDRRGSWRACPAQVERLWYRDRRGRRQGHRLAGRDEDHSGPGRRSREIGRGERDPATRGNGGDALLAEYGEGHGRQPDGLAPEGAGNAGTGR